MSAKVRLRIEHAYACGDTKTTEVEVDPPGPGVDCRDLTGWWDGEVYPHTGTGHYSSCDSLYCDSLYEATVISVPEGCEIPIGATYEWG